MVKKLILIGVLSILTMPFVMAAPPATMNNNSLRQQLELTDAQKKQAHELRAESQKKIAPYKEDLSALRYVYSTEQNMDPVKARRLKADMDALRQKIEALQIEHERKFLQILTPVQKTKYAKLKEERKKKIEYYRHLK